jgi:hypothetical protein
MTTALSTTETDSLKAEVSPVKVNAQALVIATQQHVEAARDFIRTIKERRGKVDATFDVHIKAAHQAHKALVATKKTFTDDLDEAERIIKNKVGFYQLEQERLARIEQEKARKKAEAEQQKAIEAAQKKIAATLSKAGTVTEKVDALEYALEHDSLDETERALVERQLEVLRLQLQGLEDKAAEAQRRAEEAAEAPAYIPPAAVVEKTAGVSGKKTYVVAVTEPMVLIKAIAEGKGSAGLVKAWDETTLKKLALLGIFLPGVEYKEDRTIVVR